MAEKEKKEVLLATHKYCLQPYFFTALADHGALGYFLQATSTSKDGKKEKNSLLVSNSHILAQS